LHRSRSSTIVLVDLERIHTPESIRESSRVVLHKRFTSWCLLSTSSLGVPHGTGPVTTESSVEDDLVVLEVRVPVTSVSDKGCCWSTPPSRVGVGPEDISGLLALLPEPNFNARGSPFGSVDTSAVAVELGSVGRRFLLGKGAADVVALARSIDVAVLGHEGAAGTAGPLKSAPVCGVKSDGVVALVVDAFDDINLTSGWPVGSDHPATYC
jgi:hypothetical protein